MRVKNTNLSLHSLVKKKCNEPPRLERADTVYAATKTDQTISSYALHFSINKSSTLNRRFRSNKKTLNVGNFVKLRHQLVKGQ